MSLPIKIFALDSSRNFGRQVATALDLSLSEHEEYLFEDGEPYCASLENVRGSDVFVIQSLFSDEKESVSSKILKLFIFMGSLRDASAKRITVVMPYMACARQDRKTSSRAPITTKYIARLFKSMWADRIMSLDVHNPSAIQNAYPIPVDLLEAKNLFANYCGGLMRRKGLEEVVVLSPDSGGLERARRFRRVLAEVTGAKINIACMDKEHEGKHIKGYNVISTEPIRNKSIIIYDDMVSSGKTNLECIEACRRCEASEILVSCAAHGLFVGRANDYLDHTYLKHIAVTDTVSTFRLQNSAVLEKLAVINTTALFAEAIKRTHKGESLSDLIQNGFRHSA